MTRRNDSPRLSPEWAPKRTYLTALAALIGLAAALFAALPSVEAAACTEHPTVTTLAIGETCTVGGWVSNDPVFSHDPQIASVLRVVGTTAWIVGVRPGRTYVEEPSNRDNFPITVTGSTSDAPSTELGARVTFQDSDGIVPAGTTLKANIHLTVEPQTSGFLRYWRPYWIRLSGGLTGGCEGASFAANTKCTNWNIAVTNNVGGASVSRKTSRDITITIPSGTPAGQYTISTHLVKYVSGRGDLDPRYNASGTFTVGNPGTNISTANLQLARTVAFTAEGNVDGMRHARAIDLGSSPETAATMAGKSVFLNATIRNSLGNPPNPAGMNGITISAPGATIRLHRSIGTVIPGVSGSSTLLLPQRVSGETHGPMASNNFTVSRATPGTVPVSVTAVGPDGIARTEVITLTFTGPANKLTLTSSETTLLNHYRDRDTDGTGTDTDTDRRDDLSFVLAATDKAGNAADPGTSGTVTIRDPDGNLVERGKIALAPGITKSGGRTVVPIEVAAGVTAANPLKSGEYTIEVANSSTLKASAKFTVVGLASGIALEADEQMPSRVGQVVTVTARVTGADGANAPDGTMVSFASAGANAGVRVATRIGSTGNVATKDGQAAAKFVVATSGTAVITATADSASSTLVLTSTAGKAPEPDPVEVHDTSGLASIRMNSFTTWIAPNSTTAAELFPSLAGRGATSIQLWNGNTWLRYSIIDGAMVPGSVDFTIASGNVVYISG